MTTPTIHPYVFIGLTYNPIKKPQLDFTQLRDYLMLNYPKAFETNRKRDVVTYRQAIMSIVYAYKERFVNVSLVKVGMMFKSSNDHSTVIHSISGVKDWIKYPEQFEKEMEIYLSIKKEIANFINNYE